MVRLELPIYESIKQKARASGASSVAQYIADLAAIDTGHYDRVRDLHQEVFKIA